MVLVETTDIINACRLALSDHEGSVCGDHSCVFGAAKGMGTNGGCRCFKDLEPRELARCLQQLVLLKRAERLLAVERGGL